MGDRKPVLAEVEEPTLRARRRFYTEQSLLSWFVSFFIDSYERCNSSPRAATRNNNREGLLTLQSCDHYDHRTRSAPLGFARHTHSKRP